MVFTNDGVNEIINWLVGASATAPIKLNVGDEDNAPNKSDSSLTNELSRVSFQTSDFSDNQVEFSATINSAELVGENLKEFGVNNATTAGTQFSRSIHSIISKTNNIEVIYTIKLRLTN